MSGFCSAHMGHDPACGIRSHSSPEEAAKATAYEKAFSAGVHRGIEATCEWLEGAQWDEQGQPMARDPIIFPGGRVLTDEQAGIVAGAIRGKLLKAADEKSSEYDRT